MLTRRQEQILDFLKINRYIKVKDLAKELYISEATARREIAELKNLGLLERDHGGAIYVEHSEDVHIFVRREQDAQDKLLSATIASHSLPPFLSAFADNSSTVLALSNIIDLRYKTIVTNGLALASELSKKESIEVILPMGFLKNNSNAIIGSQTVRCLNEMHFDLYLGSCAAIDENGSYETSGEQAEIKRAAMNNSDIKILVVDKTKFDKKGTFKTSSLKDYDYIFTNAKDDLVKKLKEKGINIKNK